MPVCGAAALALGACLASAQARADDRLTDTAAAAGFVSPDADADAARAGAEPFDLGLREPEASGAVAPPAWDLAQIANPTGQDRAAIGPPAPPADSPVSGPPEAAAVPLTPSGHVPREFASHKGFFAQAGSIKTEMILLTAYVGGQSIPKLFRETVPFHFKDEGWFGKDTANVGMDKLTHAFNTYLIAEILHHRIHRNTGGSDGDAVTAAVLAAALMALNETSDAIEPDSGYSLQDIAMNVAGAAFSAVRNTVPGLKEKLAFKIEIVPNGQIYSRIGKPHYAQQRFMFSLKGAGFHALDRSPLRYLDLQTGYYATDFLNSDREKGITPKRHLFVGVGLNLGELLFGESRSRVGRAAYSVLDYVQVPYTSLRYDTTGRLGS